MKRPSFAKSLIRVCLLAATLCSVSPKAFAADADQRKFPAAGILINNLQFGETNGCSEDLGVSGHMTCGHPGHVSEVTWSFLRVSPEGDIYQITRKYPADSDAPKTDTKEATYSGNPFTLWSDDFQTILLRSKPAA